MTWNTDSIGSAANKQKKDASKRHLTFKSRRPSWRHRITLNRSRHYSTSSALRKKCTPPQIHYTFCTISPQDSNHSCGQVSSDPSKGQHFSEVFKLKENASQSSCSHVIQPAENESPVACSGDVGGDNSIYHTLHEAKCPHATQDHEGTQHQSQQLHQQKESLELAENLPKENTSSLSLGVLVLEPNEDDLSSKQIDIIAGNRRYNVGVDMQEDLGPEPTVIKDYREMTTLFSGYNVDMVTRLDPGPKIHDINYYTSDEDSDSDIIPCSDIGPDITVLMDDRKTGTPPPSVDNEICLTTTIGGDTGPEITIIQDRWNIQRSEDADIQQKKQKKKLKRFNIKRKENILKCNDSMPTLKASHIERSFYERNKSKFSLRKKIYSTLRRKPTAAHQVVKEDLREVELYGEDISSTAISEIKCVSLEDIRVSLKSTSSNIEEKKQDDTEGKARPSRHVTQRRRNDFTGRYSVAHAKWKNRRIRTQIFRRPRKIFVVGDMTSGKTNLISAYCKDRFTENYTPTIFHCCQTDARMHGENIDLVMMEVSGRDDFEPLRRRAYRKVDAVVICYAVDNIFSFNRVKDFWVPELKRHAPKAPFILVGTKRDLRDEARDRLDELKLEWKCEDKDTEMARSLRAEVEFNDSFVSMDRGKRMASSVAASGFYECSSLYRDATRDVFESATKIAMQKSRRKRKQGNIHPDLCSIL